MATSTTHDQATYRAIGARIAQDVAALLVDNPTFWRDVESKRPTFIRGVVAATRRDATGVNQVRITRTGAKTDTTWYEIYGTMYVPVAGDDVQAVRVGGTSLLILGARHGGRPNEQTIMYPGQTHRLYDSGRALLHKHGDDHHTRHYRSDGATVAHHHSEAGHHKHVGDHVHNAASLSDGGTPTAPYHRKTHAAGRYEHHGDYGDGAGERLVRHHAPTGHGHYVANGAGGTAVHLHDYGGHTHPKGHRVADDGAGTAVGRLYLQHANGQRAMDHDGAAWRAYANHGSAILKHDGTDLHIGSDADGNPQVRIGSNGNGGLLKVHRQNASDFHLLGDDGAGLLHARHGAGNRAWDHDGDTHTMYSQGSWAIRAISTEIAGLGSGGRSGVLRFAATGPGWQLGDDGAGKFHSRHYNGGRMHDHDGTTHQVYSGGVAVIQHVTVGNQGGQLNYKRASFTSFHTSGEDGGGNMQHVTQGTRIKTIDTGGNGMLHQDAHAMATVISGGGVTIPLAGGNIYNLGGSGQYNQPHFKIVTATFYYTGGSNAGDYRHGATHPAHNQGYGADTAGTFVGIAGWAQTQTFGDLGTTYYGKTYSGASAWAGTVATRTQVVQQ